MPWSWAHVKRATSLAQNHGRGLRNGAIEEAIAVGFQVVADGRDVVPLGRCMRLKLDLRQAPLQFGFQLSD